MLHFKDVLLNYMYGWVKTNVSSVNKKSVLCVVTGGVDSIVNATILLNSFVDIPVSILFMGFKEQNEKAFEEWIKVKYSPNRYNIIKPTHPSFNDDLSNIDTRYAIIAAYVALYSDLNQSVSFGSITKSEHCLVPFFKRSQECFDFYPLIDLYKSECKEIAEHFGLPKEIINSKSIMEDSFGYSFDDLEWLSRENESTKIISSTTSPMQIPHWALFDSNKKALITKIYVMKKTNQSINIDSSKMCLARTALPGILV